jgi:hypothetical protein
MGDLDWSIVAGVVLLAAVSFLALMIPKLDWLNHQSLLSFAGGAAAALIFIHLLPGITLYEGSLREAVPLTAGGYLIALAGLIVYYTIEHWARCARDTRGDKVFFMHMSLFALYGAIIGFLMLEEHTDPIGPKLLFAVVVALHMTVNDEMLRKHHEQQYDRFGAWILSGSVLVGAAVGHFFDSPDWLAAILHAFFAGAILLNVLKEEVPPEEEGRLRPLLFGVVLFVVLFLLTS